MHKEELLVISYFIYFILILWFFSFTKTAEEDAERGAPSYFLFYFIFILILLIFFLRKQLKRMQKEELLVILCELYKECMTIKQVFFPPIFLFFLSFKFCILFLVSAMTRCISEVKTKRFSWTVWHAFASVFFFHLWNTTFVSPCYGML